MRIALWSCVRRAFRLTPHFALAIIALLTLGQGAAFAQGNNVNIACNGTPIQLKLCKTGQSCNNAAVVALAPAGASASPQDNLNFTGIPASGATIEYSLSVPNLGTLNGNQQDSPSSGTITNPNTNYSIAIGGSDTKQFVVPGPGTYSQQIQINQPAQQKYAVVQYSVKCTANPSTGSVTITKSTGNVADNGTFTFTSTNATINGLSLTTVNGTKSQTFSNIAPGSYTVTEDDPTGAGFTFASLTCTDSSGGTTTTPATRTANLVVAAGDVIQCTWNNRKNAAQTGSVTIIKQTGNAADNGTFTFTSNVAALNNQSLATVGGTATTGSITVPVGTNYTITETDPAPAFSLTDLDCTGAAAFTKNVAGRTATIDVAAGNNVICTFTNTKQATTGSVTIIKQTGNAADNGTFTFTSSEAALNNQSLTTVAGTATTGSITVPAGNGITITETDPAPAFSLTNLNCIGATNFTPNIPGRTATIDVSAGDNVQCTFTNTKVVQQGSLSLTKTPSQPNYTTVGENITYTYVVTNTDGTTITNIAVTDNKIASVTCLALTLGPGASTTCTGNYPITAADMAAGSVTNEATATGVDPNGPVTSNKATATIKRNDDFIRDRTKEVIKNFLYRRADQLLSNEPDRNRLIRRLPGSLWGGQNAQTAQAGSTGSTFTAAGGQGEGTRIAFATSLSQLAADKRAARQKKPDDQMMGLGAGSGGSLKDDPPLPVWNSGFDLWVEGHYTHFDDDQGKADRSGRLGVMYFGADYLINPGLLLGALAQFDWMEDSSNTLKSNVDGRGWMAGPYMSARLSENIFFDARAAWGESDNDISPFGTYEDSFHTKRWLVRGNLTGNWNFGNWRLTPSASVARIEEDQEAYIDSLGISIPGQDLALGRVTFGPEIGYRYFASDGSIIEPHMALQGLWDFEKPDTLTLGSEVVGPDDFRGKFEAGVMFMMPEGASVRATGSYDGIGSDDFHAYGGQMWVNLPLH